MAAMAVRRLAGSGGRMPSLLGVLSGKMAQSAPFAAAAATRALGTTSRYLPGTLPPRAFRGSRAANALLPVAGDGCRSLYTSPVPPQLYMRNPTHITTLRNGLRVATERTGDPTVTVGVFLDAGSRYETAETNGVAHFLEHMLFKGTARRTREQLEREVEDMGAHLNAYTAREQAAYYAKAFPGDLPQAVDILADVLQNSKLDSDAIEEERHVILREMEEVEKSYEEVIFDRLHMTAFRRNPLGYTILGPPKNIKTINRDDIKDYIRMNYTADRMVIAAAGDVDHKQLVELVERHFSKVPPAIDPGVHIRKEKPWFYGSEIRQNNPEIGPLVHVAIGYRSVGWTNPDQPAFMLMQQILGSYDRDNEGVVPGLISAKRLINNCANRDEVGCVQTFQAFNTCYKDIGLFGFYVTSSVIGIFHCIDEGMFGVCQLAYSLVEEEVAIAKRSLKNTLFGSLENTTALCEEIARQVLVYNRRIPLDEMFRRIDAIDAEEIRRVAYNRLYDAEMAVAAIGDVKGILPYQQLRIKTHMFRW